MSENFDERYKKKREDLKDRENVVIVHVTNSFIKFFYKYNEYKKGDNAMPLKNVFALAILGKVRKCVDSQTKLLKNISKISKY